MKRKIKNKQGFTLVEITIAVGIILLLAALSIHSLLRAKINSNDGAALGNVKAIANALEAYKVSKATYTDNFRELIGGQPPYLSEAFSDRSHQGYDFYIVGANQNVYIIFAQPQRYGVTGSNFIVCDQSGTTRFDKYGVAAAIIDVTAEGYGLLISVPPPPPGYESQS